MTIDDLGNGASILSLLISVVTLYILYHIKKKFIFNITIDKASRDLKKATSEISNLLNDYEANIHEINEKFDVINVKLRYIKKGASGDLLKDINKAMSKISKYNKKSLLKSTFSYRNITTAREIKTSLSGINEEFNNVKTEIKVGK